MQFQCHDCVRSFPESKCLSAHLWYYPEACHKWQEEADRVSHALKRARNNNPSLEPDLDVNKRTSAAVMCAQKRARHTDNNLSLEPDLGMNEGISAAVTCAWKRARYSNLSLEPDLGVNKDISAVPDIVLELEASPVPEFPLALFSFSGQRWKVPCALKDYIPHCLEGLPLHLHPAPSNPVLPTVPEVLGLASIPDPEPEPEVDPGFTTEPNGFRLYWRYTRKPQTDPEVSLTLADLADDDMPEQHHLGATVAETLSPCSTTADFFYPFPNVTVYRYIKWFQGTSGTLSAADLDHLTCNMISLDDFNPKDLRNFSTAWEMKWLDKYGSTDVPFAADDDWKKGSVTIHVPNTNHKYASESASSQFLVSGILYHPLLEVIKAACQSSKSEAYHWC